ncbi:MAG: GNAT family N-acetyltransferase [Nanoarchaeota archaeon]|nr:GNAT family N-acetyltransferase [Nanoarchaeota archaeon]
MRSSVAGLADLDSVTACIADAFASDPIWSVALARRNGRTDHHEAYWRIFVKGAMRFGTVHKWDLGTAVSVWIPPEKSELTSELESDSRALINRYLDTKGITALNELYQRFKASRSEAPEPHAYLALLATHRDYRGRGIGQALLASDLREWDVLGVPSYLESSNPANDHRYIRAGFTPIGGFDAVLDDARVTTMWRPVKGTI